MNFNSTIRGKKLTHKSTAWQNKTFYRPHPIPSDPPREQWHHPRPVQSGPSRAGRPAATHGRDVAAPPSRTPAEWQLVPPRCVQLGGVGMQESVEKSGETKKQHMVAQHRPLNQFRSPQAPYIRRRPTQMESTRSVFEQDFKALAGFIHLGSETSRSAPGVPRPFPCVWQQGRPGTDPRTFSTRK